MGHNLIFIFFFFKNTHIRLVATTQRAESMLQQQHYNAELVRAIAENVTLAWGQLMYHAEERQKLVMASTNWYKTAEQVRLLEITIVHWFTCSIFKQTIIFQYFSTLIHIVLSLYQVSLLFSCHL